MDKNQETIELLKTYNQDHIINLLHKLNEKQKEELFLQSLQFCFAYCAMAHIRGELLR